MNLYDILEIMYPIRSYMDNIPNQTSYLTMHVVRKFGPYFQVFVNSVRNLVVKQYSNIYTVTHCTYLSCKKQPAEKIWENDTSRILLPSKLKMIFRQSQCLVQVLTHWCLMECWGTQDWDDSLFFYSFLENYIIIFLRKKPTFHHYSKFYSYAVWLKLNYYLYFLSFFNMIELLLIFRYLISIPLFKIDNSDDLLSIQGWVIYVCMKLYIHTYTNIHIFQCIVLLSLY